MRRSEQERGEAEEAEEAAHFKKIPHQNVNNAHQNCSHPLHACPVRPSVCLCACFLAACLPLVAFSSVLVIGPPSAPSPSYPYFCGRHTSTRRTSVSNDHSVHTIWILLGKRSSYGVHQPILPRSSLGPPLTSNANRLGPLASILTPSAAISWVSCALYLTLSRLCSFLQASSLADYLLVFRVSKRLQVAP